MNLAEQNIQTNHCEELEVLRIEPLGLGTAYNTRMFSLYLSRPKWQNWKPGQFIMLRPNSFDHDNLNLWGPGLLWGRPFCICREDPDSLVIVFQALGRGTMVMSQLKTHDQVTVWGPLGNSFKVENKRPTLLLAGGIGVAPFIGYALKHPTPKFLSLVFGHRLPLPCYPVHYLPEDLTLITKHEQKPEDLQVFLTLIEERMAEYSELSGLVLACGPKPFLKTVQKHAKTYNVETQLSLETKMSCGNGACLGCTVGTTDKYVERFGATPLKNWPIQVCSCGPIFWADTIDLDA